MLNSSDFSMTLVLIPNSWVTVFQLLEKSIIMFVKNELKMFRISLTPEYGESVEIQSKDKEVIYIEEDEQRRSSTESFLKITLHFLERMKQEGIADFLQSSKRMLIPF